MKYQIAINRKATGKLPQGDPRWATFNDDFENMSLELLDIANAIYTGHAYTTWHEGRRKLDHFISGQHIAIDMDTGDERSSIDQLINHPLVRTWGSLIHTTPSHTDDAPRARVIFLLDEPITDANAYTTATNFLMSQFDGADTVCKDASRFFYGAKDCIMEWPGGTLPMAALRVLYKQWTKAHPTWNARQPERTNVVTPERMEEARQRRQADDVGMSKYAKAAFDKEVQALSQAANGHRNHQLNTAAFSLAQLIAAGQLPQDEVSAVLRSTAAGLGLGQVEIERTIRSGFEAGMKQPRAVAQ